MTVTHPIRVLVVDDDVLVLEAIRELVQAVGYTVVGEAVDGIQAVEMTKDLHPHVVLMDIKMPRLDGLSAARRIQEECPTPVVALTAFDEPELVEEAGAAGVGAYLVKLPQARELERAVTIAIARFEDLMTLRRLNEELDAYAHTVAHDLKAPLSLITGYAELLALEYETLSPDIIVQSAHSIFRGTKKMASIINNLLLFASTRKAEDVALAPLDMDAIVQESLTYLAQMIEENQAEMVLPDVWPVAMGYAPWVEAVWTNYISNALKYGGSPPRIELGGALLPEAPGWVRFWVRDNGPGIPLQEQDKLFVSRLGWERASGVKRKGHGLGLSIVRRIVERLGGTVGVKSASGEGCTFYFTLPEAKLEEQDSVEA